MAPKLKGKSFINTLEFKSTELEFLLDRAKAIKKARGKKGKRPLDGRSVALVFFNPSLRTRVSFEVGIAELGGQAVTMSVGSESWSLEYKENAVMDQDKTEHIKDAAQVLSRYVDAIAVRSFPGLKSYDEDMSDPVINSFRKYSKVPVINMESALWHPCQAMADAMTIQEKHGKIKGRKVTLTWAYHPKALPMAVGNSFAAIMSQLGADLTIAHPPEFALPGSFLDSLPRAPNIVHSKEEGLNGAEVVYAKSWGGASYYGKWEEEKKIREGLKSWICDSVPKGATFLHCLPVRRNVEVADAVLDASAIYDEAENRLHVQKAILSELV
ncbi:MAG: N-acetylornithine carbamoyltransferase [Planctomycetota bacterium]|nr:MAG: N-acetylornithine carbamoyltransferase [Planctomycetota bacterium]